MPDPAPMRPILWERAVRGRPVHKPVVPIGTHHHQANPVRHRVQVVQVRGIVHRPWGQFIARHLPPIRHPVQRGLAARVDSPSRPFRVRPPLRLLRFKVSHHSPCPPNRFPHRQTHPPGRFRPKRLVWSFHALKNKFPIYLISIKLLSQKSAVRKVVRPNTNGGMFENCCSESIYPPHGGYFRTGFRTPRFAVRKLKPNTFRTLSVQVFILIQF